MDVKAFVTFLFSERTALNFFIALEALMANKTRSMLTALGIIFGVAAVIAMLAIGNGARQEILDQMKLVGVNNVVISPKSVEDLKKEADNLEGEKGAQKKFTPGLSMSDVKAIREVVPGIEKISPEIILEVQQIAQGKSRKGNLVGVENDFFSINNQEIESGTLFNQQQQISGAQVCIIGHKIKTRLFPNIEPIGNYIKCGTVWLKIIGVTKEKNITSASMSSLGIRNYNEDVYAPIQTILIRFTNRTLITKAMLEAGNSQNEDDESEAQNNQVVNPNQLDRLVVQMNQSTALDSSSAIMKRLLLRRHNQVEDVVVSVPELLLKQQQRTKDIFNFVLGAIAGISLLVGGIGIMNIMLASVLERIKEIGIRLSMGATKVDIIQQFLFESVLISLTGGLAGVILGVIISYSVSSFADIKAIVSLWSIVLSFGVSAITGLVFGINPARNAANQDPIKSLRYE
jgi:putative ABC transport system permease protein